MKSIDLSNVQETKEYSRPTPGAYICTITGVEDVPVNEKTGKGDYLKIAYDITEGEFKGYYSKLREDHPDWTNAGTYYRSYKEKALGMFKRFCSAVTKSNPGFTFDGNKYADEKTLIGKKVGILFQSEEYYANDGSRKTRLIVNKEFPIDEIDKQKTPMDKTIPDDSFTSVPEGSSEDLPF